MPAVMEYEEVKKAFPSIFEYVSTKREIVTVLNEGKPAIRISPITVYRTTEPDPELRGEINFNLFDDESSDWKCA
jgi:PHD/YefM family antitoxin component YafN of YafNO toxin-antitoxin module